MRNGDVRGGCDVSAILQAGLLEFLGKVFVWIVGIVGGRRPALWLCDLSLECIEGEERSIGKTCKM